MAWWGNKGIDPEIVALRERVTRAETLLETVRTEFNAVWRRLEDLRAVVAVTEPQPTSFFGNIPLHVTDEEEDAKWQLDNDLIDEEMYKDILKEVGLEPNVKVHY